MIILFLACDFVCGGYETKPFYGKMIVDRDSATRNCTEREVALDENHVGMVKPSGVRHGAYLALVTAVRTVPVAPEPPVAQIKPVPSAPKATTEDAPRVSKEQLEEIRQLDAIFAGLDETDLRNFFGYDQMVDLNMRMYQARIKHFEETGDRSFELAPYVQGQEMLIDTSIAGEHLHRLQGGGGYDFDPSQIALIVLPRRYSDNKKILLRYENSTSLPTSVVSRRCNPSRAQLD